MTWAPDYATAAQLRSYLGEPAVDEDDAADVARDTLLFTPACRAASRLIDRSCSRQFGTTDDGEDPPAVERSYFPFYIERERRWYLSIDDLFTTDDLEIDGTAYDADTSLLLPLNAVASGRPYLYLALPSSTSATTPVPVTAHWGWPAVPDAIVQATLLQAARFAMRKDAPFGVAGSPDMGNALRLLQRLDPDVAVTIGPYRRYW